MCVYKERSKDVWTASKSVKQGLCGQIEYTESHVHDLLKSNQNNSRGQFPQSEGRRHAHRNLKRYIGAVQIADSLTASVKRARSYSGQKICCAKGENTTLKSELIIEDAES